jgi:pyruvate formate lyase activating enzyme
VKLLVGNIQRFCIHDGPGIRTAVFLKGCSIHCPWCANPENMEQNIQMSCLDGVTTYGRWIEHEEIFKECLKDSDFYGTEGGVTFSGGEPLLWAEKMIPLIDLLRSAHISLCVETSLFVPTDMLCRILFSLNHLIIDVKILDSIRCQDILGGNLDLFYQNLKTVEDSGVETTFRIPLIQGFTFTEDNLVALRCFMTDRMDAHFEIFKCHRLAEEKYAHLGLPPPPATHIDESRYKEFLADLQNRGIKIKELTW